MRKLVLVALGAVAAAAAVQFVRTRSSRMDELGEAGLDLDVDVIGDVPGWAGEAVGQLAQANGSH